MSRPTEVTVLGIINIVWGTLKLLNSLVGVAMLFALPYFFNWMSSLPAASTRRSLARPHV